MTARNWRCGQMASEGTRTFLSRVDAVRREATLCGVDIEHHLDTLDSRRGVAPHWRTSVVALLETLDFNPAPKSRRELAKDLGFTGNLESQATLAIWLHGEVMIRLRQAASG
jgi:hypothetical protein